MSQIILASGSPRRKELLEQMGLTFEVCPAKGEEVITSSVPSQVVEELSKQKAEEVASGVLSWMEEPGHERQDTLVIGADTVVALDGKILGKPKDEEEAFAMLSALSGRSHKVYTGVTLVFIDKERTGEISFHDETTVTMYPMSDKEIRDYIGTGEPMDKAGAYGIQGRCGIFIQGIEGDYYNVVGLPIGMLYQKLKDLGFWS